MTIELESADFVRALGRVGRVIERRNTIPTLTTTRLRQTPDGLTLSATDLDLQIDARVAAETNGSDLDQLLQQPAHVAKAVKASGAERVQLANGDGRIRLHGGGLVLDLPALPPEDLPALEVADGAAARWSGTLGADAVHAIRRVSGAASTEETRYYLNGVYIEADRDWGMRAVATDGHRLYVAPFQVPDAAGDLPGIIVPHKTVRELLQLAGRDRAVSMRVAPKVRRNDDGTAQMLTDQAGADHIALDVHDIGVGLASKLIDGNFPEYQRVIPSAVATTATFDRGQLARAVASVRAGAGGGRAEAIHLEPGPDNVCRLSCRWSLIDAEAAMPVPFEGSARTPFGISGRYLAEALERFAGCDRVTLQFGDDVRDPGGDSFKQITGPIKVVSPEDDAFLAVVMPMRI